MKIKLKEVKSNSELVILELLDNKKSIKSCDNQIGRDFLITWFGSEESFIEKFEEFINSIEYKNEDLWQLFCLFWINTKEELQNPFEKFLSCFFINISNSFFRDGKIYLYEDSRIKNIILNGVLGVDIFNKQQEDIYMSQNSKRQTLKSTILRVCEGFFQIYNATNQEGLVNAQSKIKDLIKTYIQECNKEFKINHLYFGDIEKFDQFENNNLLTLRKAKGFQENEEINKLLINYFGEKFHKFVIRKNFDMIIVIPNNQERKQNLNNDFIFPSLKENIHSILYLGHINKVKGREAQKSLKGICERIKNAEKLMNIDNIPVEKYSNILLIDDVFGSGATMNAVAEKIKKLNPNAIVTGYAMLGSFRKGFDVINEV